MNIVTADEMREIDRVTSQRFGVPSLTLMENAGTAVTGCNRMIFHIGLKVITRATGFDAGTDG